MQRSRAGNRYRVVSWALVIAWLTMCSIAQASTFSAEDESWVISQRFDFLVEEQRQGFETVRRLPDFAWQRLKHNPNFGATTKAFWFRTGGYFSSEFDGFIEIDRPYLDEVDVFVLIDGEIVGRYFLGDQRPYEQRPVAHRNFVVPIKVPSNSRFQLYLRVQSNGPPLQFQTTLWRDLAFIESSNQQTFLHSIYVGGILVIVFYNLFVFASLRELSYFYYSAYTLTLGLTLIILLGYASQFSWSETIFIQQRYTVALSTAFRIFMYLFVIQFLLQDDRGHWLYYLFRVLIVLDVMNFLFPSLLYSRVGEALVMVPSVLVPPLVLVCSMLRWVDGRKEARFFTLAWLIWTFGWSNYLSSLFAIREYNPDNITLALVAHLSETVLLALALSDRLALAKENETKLREYSESESLRAQKLLSAEEQKAEAEHQAKLAVESSLKLKSDFLTAISHELRTPMHGIFGGIQIAQKSPTQELQSPLDLIQSSAKEMMRLVNDILTYTEIQAEHVENHPQETELAPLLLRLQRRYQRLCDDKGLRLEWCIAEDLVAAVLIDKDKLYTVLSKLLDNAVKFTERGYVSLNFSSQQSADAVLLKIKVKDTGIGIDEPEVEKVFESFRQQCEGFQRRFGGLGIGLAISKRFVEVLQGDILLESKVGKGTQLTLNLPAVVCAAPVATSRHAKASNLPILIVEDNVVNQQVLSKMLNKLGHEVLIADHGGKALDVLDQQPVCLILMDLQMPVMDGFTCTQCIRQRPDELKGVPIVAVTANLMDADKSRCLEAGMDDYLKKPIKLAVLEYMLSAYL